MSRLRELCVIPTVICLLIMIPTASHAHGYSGHESLRDWLKWSELWSKSSWQTFLFIQVLLTITGILPASLVGIGAGAFFGFEFGVLLATISTSAGALIAFALARSLFRPWVERWFARRPRLQRLDAAVNNDGWIGVALLRASPVMPFAMTSYALGLTGISWRHYAIGTCASMPALFCYVALGHFAGIGANTLALKGTTLGIAITIISITATASLALYSGKLLRLALAPKTLGDHGPVS